MPFASINPSNPRTNPWNFHKKILRIGDFEKCTFFESAILNFFFQEKIFFFAFFPWKLVKVYWLARMGQNFDQAKRDNTFWPDQTFWQGVYTKEEVGGMKLNAIFTLMTHQDFNKHKHCPSVNHFSLVFKNSKIQKFKTFIFQVSPKL